MKTLFTLLGTVVLAFAADPKPNVAVTDFCGTTGIDSAQGAILSERFQAELLNTGVYRVLDRKQMDAILKEQGFQQSGACTNSDCQVQMGQLLGVDKIFAGCASKVDDLITLNVRRIDVQTGQVESQFVVDSHGGFEQALTGSCKTMALKFAGLPTGEESKTSSKFWWIGGGILAVGSAVTAIILATQDPKTSTQTISREY